ncbi:glycine cleavage system protein R [Motiliproteus sediminis]|uniref:glycine cleavage system protein R n=1 Tax=Motiliproteus sediminis TaxID=1468178 RepID=UPI001AEF7C62|nr:ACT domain-containing protein [Motiliproteus sediminis]
MKKSLVLTLIGPDKPGIVEQLSALLANHGGNWEQSSMSRLAGQFAGILIASVDDAAESALMNDLQGLEQQGLRVLATADQADLPIREGRTVRLELLGNDKPGIVREISAALASRNVSVDSLETEVVSGSMSADLLFKANAVLLVPPGSDLDDLQDALEAIAADLMVEIALAD